MVWCQFLNWESYHLCYKYISKATLYLRIMVRERKHKVKTTSKVDSYVRRCQKIFDGFNDEDFYSDKVQHIYFYGGVDQTSVQELRNDIVKANDGMNTVMNTNVNAVKTKHKPIVIHIHNMGGDAYLGISLANWLRESRVPVAVVVDGYACSAATPLLVSAPYRVMHNQAFVMIHEGAVVFPFGSHYKDGDLNFMTSIFNDSIIKSYRQVYEENTSIPKDVLEDLLSRDLFLSASQCKEYSIIDRVIKIRKRDTYARWDQYYKNNPELAVRQEQLLWKTNFNHVYLYNNDSESMFKASHMSTSDLMKLIHPLQKLLEASHKVIPKPLVIHSNMYILPSGSRFFDVSAILVRIAMSPTPILSIIDSDIELLQALPCIICGRRYMYSNTHLLIQLVYHHRSHSPSYYYHDIQDNTQLMRNVLLQLLRQFTKLPEDMLGTLFEKRVMLTAKQCLEYGIVDELIEPMSRSVS
jgi:ATP-dependent Clp protease, protease subunit